MRILSKILVVPAAALLLGTLFAACGGYSQSDAVAYCDVEKSSKGACATDTSNNACVDCYEECGDKCKAGGTCPETYSCAE